MVKYFMIGGVIIFTLIMIMVTVFAVKDIIKNDMAVGDNIFDILDYLKAEYEGLYVFWNVITGMMVIAALYFITLMI